MELRQLRALVTLADERHFTRAAALLHVAQPALSRQIRTLEAEVGLALVDRTTRRVAMTDAGTALVVRARAALAEIDAAEAEMRDRTGALTGTLTIGMTPTPGPLDLARVLAAYHREHRGIRLVVREGLSRNLAEELRQDTLDLAFITALDDVASRGLHVRPLAEEPLDLIVGMTHWLAGRTRVRAEDLRDEDFVVFREGATIRDAIHDAAARAGFAPRLAFEVSDTSRLRAIVAEGLGVAVLPGSEAVTVGKAAVCSVAVVDAAFVHQIALATRTNRRHAPAASAFLMLMADGLSSRADGVGAPRA